MCAGAGGASASDQSSASVEEVACSGQPLLPVFTGGGTGAAISVPALHLSGGA